jgi:hypothetical protein
MHTCEVKMRYDYETPSAILIACGDTAAAKLDKVWMCAYHYQIFTSSTLEYCISAEDCTPMIRESI